MKHLNLLPRWIRPLAALFPFAATLALLAEPLALFACALGDNSTAYQPTLGEASRTLELAARGQMGASYPALPLVEKGFPAATPENIPAPCLILKAMAWTEGAWQQASPNVVEGNSGPVKVSPSCGYGIMQITSGMQAPGAGIPQDQQEKIGTDYRYNIGWGAKTLVEKWNAGKSLNAVVGDRNPEVAEHWYYAIWGYNQFTFKNNPNNPDYAWPRPAFDGSQSRTGYPYQEVILGYTANPPRPKGAALWTGTPVGMPDRAQIGQTPGPIPAPSGAHAVACLQASVSRTSVQWRVAPGSGMQTAIVTINGGPGAVKWSATISGEAWLSVSPFRGDTLPVELTLLGQPGGLTVGSHISTVQISIEGASDTLKIVAEMVVASQANSYLPIITRRSIMPPGGALTPRTAP